MMNEVRLEDPRKVRKLAEEKGGRPARVAEGENKGELRIDFSGERGKELEHISWERFFEEFSDRNLVFTRAERPKMPKA